MKICLVEVGVKRYPGRVRAGSRAAMRSAAPIKLDASKTYKITARLMKDSGADGVAYVAVMLFRADGSVISGDDGAFWRLAPSGAYIALSTSWTTYTLTFGASTGHTFPAGAVMMAPAYVLGHTMTAPSHHLRECWIEDTAAAGVPITRDPYLCDRLAWEPINENGFERSEQIDHAYWFSSGLASITANATTAPDANTTAEKLVEAGGGAQEHYIARSWSATGYVGVSAFVKAAGRNHATLLLGRSGSPYNRAVVTVNLTTGALVSSDQNGGLLVTSQRDAVDCGNGWWRVSLAGLLGYGIFDGDWICAVFTSNGSTTNYAGDGVSGIYCWGMRLAFGQVAGRYIPNLSMTSAAHTAPTFGQVIGADLLTDTLRFSTAAYTTASGDTPASTPYDARVQQPGFVRSELPKELAGPIAASFGEVVLLNTDGALSELPTFGLDGQPVTVLLGEAGAARSTFIEVIQAYVEQAVVGDAQARLRLRAPDSALVRPLLTERYGGTNALPAGVDGTADDLLGRPKPRLFGYARNFAPPCVNTARYIFQVDTPNATWAVTDVTAALVRGLALTKGSDYLSASDMQSNAPAAGQYRVLSTSGDGTYFRLGTAPDGLVTCDANNGGGIAEQIARIVSEVGVSPIRVNSDTPTEADNFPSADSEAETLHGPHGGVWVHDERSALDVVAELATSIGAVFGFNRWANALSGDLEWGHETFPAPIPPDTSDVITVDAIMAIKPMADPGVGRGLPVWRVTLGYKPNRTVMNGDFNASVTQADRAALASAGLSAAAADIDVLGLFPNARELTRETLIYNEAPAGAEAARLLELTRYPRQWFEVTLPLEYALAMQTSPPRLGGAVQLHAPLLRTLLRSGDVAPGGVFTVMALELDLLRQQMRLTLRQATENVLSPLTEGRFYI